MFAEEQHQRASEHLCGSQLSWDTHESCPKKCPFVDTLSLKVIRNFESLA